MPASRRRCRHGASARVAPASAKRTARVCWVHERHATRDAAVTQQHQRLLTPAGTTSRYRRTGVRAAAHVATAVITARRAGEVQLGTTGWERRHARADSVAGGGTEGRGGRHDITPATSRRRCSTLERGVNADAGWSEGRARRERYQRVYYDGGLGLGTTVGEHGRGKGSGSGKSVWRARHAKNFVLGLSTSPVPIPRCWDVLRRAVDEKGWDDIVSCG